MPLPEPAAHAAMAEDQGRPMAVMKIKSTVLRTRL